MHLFSWAFAFFYVLNSYATPLPDTHKEEARAAFAAMNAQTINDPIHTSLWHAWRPDPEKSGAFKKVEGTLGTSVARIYEDPETQQRFVIVGDRFGLKQMKGTIGGAVDKTDQTLDDSYLRELEEELFGQLPRKNHRLLKIKDQSVGHLLSGGLYETDLKELATHGWGPCYGWFELETGYTHKELDQAVQLMNAQAALHFPVATYFSAFKELSVSEKQTQAQTLLKAFEEALEKDLFKTHTPIPLSLEAKNLLEALAQNGETPIPSAFKDGFHFAQKHVHAYTEHESFTLLPYDEWREFIKKKKSPLLLEGATLFETFGADQAFYKAIDSIIWDH